MILWPRESFSAASREALGMGSSIVCPTPSDGNICLIAMFWRGIHGPLKMNSVVFFLLFILKRIKKNFKKFKKMT